jgi:hypothetical protein
MNRCHDAVNKLTLLRFVGGGVESCMWPVCVEHPAMGLLVPTDELVRQQSGDKDLHRGGHYSRNCLWSLLWWSLGSNFLLDPRLQELSTPSEMEQSGILISSQALSLSLCQVRSNYC